MNIRGSEPCDVLSTSCALMRFVAPSAQGLAEVAGAGFCFGIFAAVIGIFYVPIRCLCAYGAFLNGS
jgi:hypothetical protein